MAAETLALRVLAPSFAGTSLPAAYAGLLREGLGGIGLFATNATAGPAALRALTDAIRSASAEAGWVPVIAVDEEGGDVSRLEARTGCSVLGPAALGAAGDPALTEATGARIGSALAAAGINLDLAPDADVNSNPANPVIGTRSFSACAQTAAEHVTAWVRGLQAEGVAACLKHFPGHGDTGTDSHVALPVLDVPLERLRERELVPFAAGIEAGAAAVMTSHIVVRALDPALPGTLSAPVLGLVREMGFEGLVVSDALDMAGASAGRGIPATAVDSLRAGADLLLLGPETPVGLVRETQQAIVAAVSAGDLPRSRLEEAAARVERLARDERFGVRDVDPPSGLDAAQVAGARAALRADGPLPRLPDLDGAQVVTVSTDANIAVGDVPWGLRSDHVVRPDGPAPELPRRPLIVQVRDAGRRPEVGALVDGLADAAVLVEWGWPESAYDGRLPRLCPRGSSLPGVAAVSEVLVEAGWRP